jgi:hypothetical protein
MEYEESWPIEDPAVEEGPAFANHRRQGFGAQEASSQQLQLLVSVKVDIGAGVFENTNLI